MDVNPLLPSSDPLSFVLIAIVIAQLALVVGAVISVLRASRLTWSGRLLWILVIIAFPFLGSIAWFVWGRSTRLERGVL